jgi:hypothetical protein
MSRHSLRPLPDQRHIYEVAIGWDRPMRTYFVIIFGTPESDDNERFDASGEPPGSDELLPLLWEGTAPGALATPAAAIALAEPFAQIPEGLAAQLEADRVHESSSVDGPVQRDWRDRLWPRPDPKGRP